MATQEEICPGFVGESWIKLLLADPLAKLVPLEPIELAVDFSRCDAEGGVVLPLELIVTGPVAVEYRVLLLAVPLTVVFTPRDPGVHVVLLREMAHNRWVGTLRVTVEGARDS